MNLRTCISLIGLFVIVGAIPLKAAEQNYQQGLSNADKALLRQGGALHSLIEVETDVVITEFLEREVGNIRKQLRTAKIRYSGLGITGDFIHVTITNPYQFRMAFKILENTDLIVARLSETPSTLTFRIKDNDRADIVEMTILVAMDRAQKRMTDLLKSQNTYFIQRIKNSNRFTTQFPAGLNPEELPRPKHYWPAPQDLTFHVLERHQYTGGDIPSGTTLLKFRQYNDNSNDRKHALIQKKVPFTLDSFLSAKLVMEPDGSPAIQIKLNHTERQRLIEFKGQSLALVHQSKIVAIPTIHVPFHDQTIMLKGDFSLQDAQLILKILRKKYNVAPLKLVREWVTAPPSL